MLSKKDLDMQQELTKLGGGNCRVGNIEVLCLVPRQESANSSEGPYTVAAHKDSVVVTRRKKRQGDTYVKCHETKYRVTFSLQGTQDVLRDTLRSDFSNVLTEWVGQGYSTAVFSASSSAWTSSTVLFGSDSADGLFHQTLQALLRLAERCNGAIGMSMMALHGEKMEDLLAGRRAIADEGNAEIVRIQSAAEAAAVLQTAAAEEANHRASQPQAAPRHYLLDCVYYNHAEGRRSRLRFIAIAPLAAPAAEPKDTLFPASPLAVQAAAREFRAFEASASDLAAQFDAGKVPKPAVPRRKTYLTVSNALLQPSRAGRPLCFALHRDCCTRLRTATKCTLFSLCRPHNNNLLPRQVRRSTTIVVLTKAFTSTPCCCLHVCCKYRNPSLS